MNKIVLCISIITSIELGSCQACMNSEEVLAWVQSNSSALDKQANEFMAEYKILENYSSEWESQHAAEIERAEELNNEWQRLSNVLEPILM